MGCVTRAMVVFVHLGLYFYGYGLIDVGLLDVIRL